MFHLLDSKEFKMRVFATVFSIFIVVGCSKNPQVSNLRTSLARVDSVNSVISLLPLDSINSVRFRLNEAKDEVRWLGADSSVSFIREDAEIINELSKASRWLKDAPNRIKGMNSEILRCKSQIEGLIHVIESGATIDAKGDTIDDAYLTENVKREIEAVNNLLIHYRETVTYVTKGLECDKDGWEAIDSLLTTKRAMWARGIAGEDTNSNEE